MRRRSDIGKKHKHDESDLQKECVKWARERGLLVVVSTGGAYYGNAATGAAMKALGYQAGTPDVLILEQNRNATLCGLAIELKVGNNELSEAQQAWFDQAEHKKWACRVARSFAEFEQHVRLHVDGVCHVDIS